MKALVERFNKIELRVDDIEVGEEESLIFWGWITTHFKVGIQILWGWIITHFNIRIKIFWAWITTHFKVEEERVKGMEVETFKLIEESLFL